MCFLNMIYSNKTVRHTQSFETCFPYSIFNLWIAGCDSAFLEQSDMTWGNAELYSSMGSNGMGMINQFLGFGLQGI